jgi:hypothetical protein
MVPSLVEYMLSGRRVQSSGLIDGRQAIQVCFGPGMPAMIGCLWYQITDLYPVPDRGPVTGFRVAGGFSLAPANPPRTLRPPLSFNPPDRAGLLSECDTENS